MQLKGKWRINFRKGQKSGVQVMDVKLTKTQIDLLLQTIRFANKSKALQVFQQL